MRKKFFSCLSALAMLSASLTVLGFPAYAEDAPAKHLVWNDETVITDSLNITEPTIIDVSGKVSVESPIIISASVTLTGGGTLARETSSGCLIRVDDGGKLSLEDVTFDGNSVHADGNNSAAIYVNDGGSVTMHDGAAIINNKKSASDRGGAVHMAGGTFEMNGGEISGSEAESYGGAIYLDFNSEFIMNGGTIKNNRSFDTSYGGGAFYVRGKLTINGGTIEANSSPVGGAIYNSSYGTTIINGGTIKDNTATGENPKGAAIFHSCKTTGESAILQIGEDADIDINNDIYLMSKNSVDKFIELTSHIKNNIMLTVENTTESRTIATAASGITLNENDMAKLHLYNSDYFLKLEDNKIVLTQTSSTRTVFLGYDANEGTGAPSGTQADVRPGESFDFTVASDVPSREGYRFLGWSTDKNAAIAEYAPGDTVAIASNTVLYAIWEQVFHQEDNAFTTALSISGWTFGDTPSSPTAAAKFGEVKFLYSDSKNGTYTDIVPVNAGNHWVKAAVTETSEYTGLESEPIEFEIAKKELSSANISEIAAITYTGAELKPVIEVKDASVSLLLDKDYSVAYENNINAGEGTVKVTYTGNYSGNGEKQFTVLPKTIDDSLNSLIAPVKKAVPQTNIETEEYTAEITWSPAVSSAFDYKTSYTATVTITPKANYTLTGISENGFKAKGALSVSNSESSGIVTVTYPATGSKSTGSGSGGGGGNTHITVTFNTNGGSKISEQLLAANSTVKEPDAPTKEGFEFSGWYTDKALTSKYDFAKKITQGLTLYAAWTEKEEGTSDNSESLIILTVGEKEARVFGVTKTNDVAPIIVNDRTMLPARFVAENLGAEVSWNEENKAVTITGKNGKNETVVILITIGSEYAVINGENIKLDSPAFIENDRTYTPIRFIAENLGAMVSWNESEQKVVITK